MKKLFCWVNVSITFAKQGALFFSFLIISNFTQAQQIPAINTQSFVILQYHHVSTQTPSSTSVSPATFEEHMAFLAKHYQVMDLAEAINKIKSGQLLPNKTVAITFDDGFKNILENGHPILEKYNFPYTIFINPAIIGVSPQQLTWAQIRQMQPLARFANHTLDHAHLLKKDNNEDAQDWLARVMEDVNAAEKIIQTNLGYSKKWLAYPFGEFNLVLKNELTAQGYIGFGQQSGAVSMFSDFGALPRFPAAGIYANLDSLETKLNSFAMPVNSVLPANNEFKAGDKLDFIEFNIDSNDVRAAAITCYLKGELLPITRKLTNIKVAVNRVLSPGRSRINCTAPSSMFSGRFYWYSYPMFTATENGTFLD